MGFWKPRRDFLHVDDLGILAYFIKNWDPTDSDSPKDDNGKPLTILNIGSGNDISIEELAENIAEASGYEGSIVWDKSKPDGHPRKQVDITKIAKLGWQPKISLKEGIQSTVEYYKENIENNLSLRL